MYAEAEKIWLKYHDKVFAYVRGKIENPRDAEDIVSDVFEKICRNLDSFNPEKASVSTWVYTITRNTVNDYYRTKRVFVDYDELYELPAPEKERDVLDTLADAMGMSYINAKIIHKKALSALRDYLKE